MRIGVAMFSYCGELTFGITSDLEVTDLDVLVDGINEAWSSLSGPKVPISGDLRP